MAPAGIPENNVHRIRGEEDPGAAAETYAAEVLSRLGPSGSFDVVQCGVGDDGHTASLFPGDPLVQHNTGICAPVWVPQKRQHRVTLLPAAISSARHLCVLVHGEDKRPAVRRALSPGIDPVDTPARILDRSSTVWFLSPRHIYEDFR
ncbi:MAG: 6-phosphogluconolactonase [Bryobacteraceae bacterium]|nr:6-phosphogluconolactonase [Bryobacteraceae bacterium]